MNDLVNSGKIIQIRDKFRMPYSDNKQTISSCCFSASRSPSPTRELAPKTNKITKLCLDDLSSKSIGTNSSNGPLQLLPSINSPASSSEPQFSVSSNNKKGQSRGADQYVSCKAKYNNKNQTLMIMKRASCNHNTKNFYKRIWWIDNWIQHLNLIYYN